MITALIRRYPVVIYVAVAFGIAWGGVALVAGLFGASLFVVFIPMAAGPTTASLMLTGVLDGKQGYRELLARLARWRVAPRWYAVALLLNPLVTLAVLGILYFTTSRAFAPGIFATDNPTALVGLALTGGLAAGLFEELGWTGFATPRLLARRHFAAAGAMLGVVWAAWHIGPEFSGASAWGDHRIGRILLWMFAGMIPFRILMTWVYRNSRSLFVGVLMHASYTGGQVLLEPINVSHTDSLLWWGLVGAGLAIVAGIVIVLDRRDDTLRAIRRRAEREARKGVHDAQYV